MIGESVHTFVMRMSTINLTSRNAMLMRSTRTGATITITITVMRLTVTVETFSSVV